MDSRPTYQSSIETPLGTMTAIAGRQGIVSLRFEDEASPETEPSNENDHLRELRRQLEEYFLKTRKEFTVPLALQGTDFQREIWSQLLSIPYGKTITYQALAKEYGNLKAIRAVAAANGANPVAILVPCHRVIGADGSLTGYAGGLWRKKWLLDHERAQLALDL